MRDSRRRLRPLFLTLLTAALFGALPGPAASQARGEAQAAYLRAAGMDQQAHDLEQTLLGYLEDREPYMLPARRKGLARYFAFIMAVTGLTADKVQRLQAGGVDIVHAITADTRPFLEQALLADLVVLGEVIDAEETPEPGDGFRSSLTIHVRTRFKGDAPGDTLVIRQRSGLTLDDAGRSRDLFAEVGATYLLLLSNGMYRYFVANRAARGDLQGTIPEETLARHYSIYRWYQMGKNRLLWGGFDRRDTERAFQEIRWLDELLRSL